MEVKSKRDMGLEKTGSKTKLKVRVKENVGRAKYP